MNRYRIALELARETHSPFEEARALEGSGICANALGDVATAINSLQQAAAIYQQIGSTRRDDVVNALAALQVGGR
jgi:tetratricopeptide (TPR) repeat protein